MVILLMTIGVVVFAPLVLEGARAGDVGRGYQGRYMLSIAVLVPLIALSASRKEGIPRNSGRVILIGGIAVVLSHVLVLNHVVRRFSVGLAGPLWWPGSAQWTPAIGIWVMVVAMAVGAAAGIALVWGRVKLSRV
jgi:hypothetical protein